MFVDKLNLLGLGLIIKQVVDILGKAYQVGLTHSHLHLTLVDLSQVHHLVNQIENTLGITTDGFVNGFAAGFVVVLDKREQRCENQRHWGADLVTHVHEETQLGLAHLLGMDMGLEAQLILLLMATVNQILPYKHTDNHCVEEISPSRAVPRTVDNHRELSYGCFYVIALGLNPESVGALWQMRQGKHVLAWLQAVEWLAINTI